MARPSQPPPPPSNIHVKRLLLVAMFLVVNIVCQFINPRLATLCMVPCVFILYLKRILPDFLAFPAILALLVTLVRLNTDTAAMVVLHLFFYAAVMIKHNYMYQRKDEHGPPCT